MKTKDQRLLEEAYETIMEGKQEEKEFKKVIREFEQTYTDRALLEIGMMGIADIINEPSDLRAGRHFTANELSKVRGFYKSEWVMDEILFNILGQALVYAIDDHGLDSTDVGIRDMAINYLVNETKAKRERVIPKLIHDAVIKFGDVELDKGKVEMIKARYQDHGNN